MSLLDDLKQRLDDLKKGETSLRANLLATNGAIQECQFWIDKLSPGLTLSQLQNTLGVGDIEFVDKKEP